ncbi:MAG: hypothetical protein AB7O59_21865 [Pirellulales bacterium]
MGDSYQQIVDLHATVQEAPRLARTVLRYLIERGVICGEASDSALGGPRGYRPGPNFKEAVGGRLVHFLEVQPNGVCCEIGRTVFHAGGNSDKVLCPICHTDASSSDWTDAVDRWFQGDDAAAHTCQHCGIASRITQWDFDFVWAFGNLGFTFWNWPPLRPQFVEQISSLLAHEVRVVCGRL